VSLDEELVRLQAQSRNHGLSLLVGALLAGLAFYMLIERHIVHKALGGSVLGFLVFSIGALYQFNCWRQFRRFGRDACIQGSVAPRAVIVEYSLAGKILALEGSGSIPAEASRVVVTISLLSGNHVYRFGGNAGRALVESLFVKFPQYRKSDV
jgi:hypothetical protein